MASPIPSSRRALSAALLAAALLSSAARTQPPPATGVGTLSLSDSEKAAMLANNTEDSVADARSGLGDGTGPRRQVHGEIGAAIGSRGTRGIYGAAAIPLGDNAAAAVSFESERYGRPH